MIYTILTALAEELTALFPDYKFAVYDTAENFNDVPAVMNIRRSDDRFVISLYGGRNGLDLSVLPGEAGVNVRRVMDYGDPEFVPTVINRIGVIVAHDRKVRSIETKPSSFIVNILAGNWSKHD